MTEDRDVDIDGYNRLVASVAIISPEAADYMINEAPKLEDFDYRRSIMSCFDWEHTPQGIEFWKRIAIKLGQWPL